jgi:hypothetical protein
MIPTRNGQFERDRNCAVRLAPHDATLRHELLDGSLSNGVRATTLTQMRPH